MIGSPPPDRLDIGVLSRECFSGFAAGEIVTVPPLFWDVMTVDAMVGTKFVFAFEVDAIMEEFKIESGPFWE